MPPLWQKIIIEESNAIWTVQDFLQRQLAWIESFRQNLKVSNPFDGDAPHPGHVERIFENAKGLAERRQLMSLSDGQVERLLRYEGIADVQKTWSRVVDPEITDVLHAVRDILSGSKNSEGKSLTAIVRRARTYAGKKFEGIEVQIGFLLNQTDARANSLLSPFEIQRATLTMLFEEMLKQGDIPTIDRSLILTSIQGLRDEAPIDHVFWERLKPLWHGIGVNAFYDFLKKVLSTLSEG